MLECGLKSVMEMGCAVLGATFSLTVASASAVSQPCGRERFQERDEARPPPGASGLGDAQAHVAALPLATAPSWASGPTAGHHQQEVPEPEPCSAQSVPSGGSSVSPFLASLALQKEVESLTREQAEAREQAEKDHAALLSQMRVLESELEEQLSQHRGCARQAEEEATALKQQLAALDKQLRSQRQFMDVSSLGCRLCSHCWVGTASGFCHRTLQVSIQCSPARADGCVANSVGSWVLSVFRDDDPEGRACHPRRCGCLWASPSPAGSAGPSPWTRAVCS